MLALAAAVPALAHRGHSSLSVVEIAADGSVKVSHRMAAHDVEPALRDIAPDAQPNLDDPEALAALVRHVERAFTLATADGRRVVLRHIGSELSGDDVRLSFEGTISQLGADLLVDSDLLESYYPGQENQVNVRRGGVTRTLVFRRGDAPGRVAAAMGRSGIGARAGSAAPM